jgi:hypothetical protein
MAQRSGATTVGETLGGPRPGFSAHWAVGTDWFELRWGSRIDWSQRVDFGNVPIARDTWLIYEHDMLLDVREGPLLLSASRQPGWREGLRQRIVSAMALHNIPANTRGFGVLDVEFLPTMWPERRVPWNPSGTVPTYMTAQVASWKNYINTTRPDLIHGRTQAQIDEAYRTTWEAAVRDIFLACLEEARALRPMLKWGYYGYPNTLLHGENGDPNNARRQMNNELQWLWDASDAIYPSLYHQFVSVPYETPLTHPAMKHDWFVYRFFESNLLEARLRAGPEKPVQVFIGLHYFEFVPAPYGGQFLTARDMNFALSLPRRYNADGVIFWDVIPNQAGFTLFQDYMNTQVLGTLGAQIPPPPPPAALVVQDTQRARFDVYWEVATEATELYQHGRDWAAQLDLRGTAINQSFAMVYEGNLPSIIDVRTQGLSIAQNPAFEARMRSDMRAAVAWAARDIPIGTPNALGCIDIESIYSDWSNWLGGPGIYPTYSEVRHITTDWATYITTQRPELIAGLSVAAREEVFRSTYENAFARLFLIYLDEAKLARPDLKWGYYGYPVSGGPAFWDNQRAGTLTQYNDSKRWLWDASDVIYPSMYQISYAAAPGVMPLAGEVSAWDNKAWNQVTLREARRVGGVNKLVIAFESFRFFEFVPTRNGQFISETNLRDSIQLPREMGADGVVIWDIIRHDADRANFQQYLDTRALPMIARTIVQPPLPVVVSRVMGQMGQMGASGTSEPVAQATAPVVTRPEVAARTTRPQHEPRAREQQTQATGKPAKRTRGEERRRGAGVTRRP